MTTEKMTTEEIIERIDRYTKPLVFYGRDGYLNSVLWKKISESYCHKSVPFCTLVWDGEFVKIEHKIPVGTDGGTQTQVTYIPLDRLYAIPGFLRAAYHYHRGLQWLSGEKMRRIEDLEEEK